MIWLKKTRRTWLESFVIKILQTGPMPKHIAFIIDGNRRYANKYKLKIKEGHYHGFKTLSKNIDWFLDLGIKEMSVYVISIENFKRSEEEVKDLMQLIGEKLKELLEEKDELDKYGVCVRVFGDISLLPKDIQKTISKLLYFSKNNSLFINLCIAYSSREEINIAAEEIANGVSKGLLNPDLDINEELLDQCMYNSSEPDIVIRTSGEVRLSDFLLWQGSYSLIQFVKQFWPEFTIWNLFICIWNYQHYFKHIKNGRENSCMARKLKLVEDVYRRVISDGGELSSEKELQDYIKERQERINNFISYVRDKRLRKLQEITNS